MSQFPSASADSPGALAPPRRTCANCGEALPDRSPRPPAPYCPQCGQETQIQPPTLREFAQQFGGAYFSTEGALWRTLRLLLLKPGELSAQYLAGRRKHYVLPLRLYLTVSVLVLLLMRLSATFSLDAPGAVQLDGGEMKNVTVNIGLGRAGLRDGAFYCENLPVWLCARLQRRIDIKPDAFEGVVRQVGERFVANLGSSLFVLLPTFALWLKLVYANRRLRYTEHLVFALHVHALWFIVLGLMLVPLDVTKLAVLAVPVYTLMAMKRVYGGRLWPRLLRAGVVSLLYLVVLAVAMTGVGLWSLLS
jgi:hypothetical protein